LLHESTVQAFKSSQSVGSPPVHFPSAHSSLSVQGSPSSQLSPFAALPLALHAPALQLPAWQPMLSQLVPSLAALLEHFPSAGLQLSTVQSFLSSQSLVVTLHSPPLQNAVEQLPSPPAQSESVWQLHWIS
jgi:hypothetical protein